MLAGPPTKSVSTTVEDVTKSYIFGPDCVVEVILPEATVELVKAVEVDKYRLIAINDHPISDSGELRNALQQASAGEGNEHHVVLTFQYTDVPAEKVTIENSVLFNGAQSMVARPNTAAVQDYIASITEPPPHHPDAQEEEEKQKPREPQKDATQNDTAAAQATGSSSAPSSTLSRTSSTAAVPPMDASALAEPHTPPVHPDSRLNASQSSSASTLANDKSSTQSPLFHLERTEDDITPSLSRPGSEKGTPMVPPSRDVRIANKDAADANSSNHTTNTAGTPHHMSSDAYDSHRQHSKENGPDKTTMTWQNKSAPPPLSSSALAATSSSVVATLRQRFMDALSRVRPGCCVICLVQDFNPIAEIELLAMTAQRPVVSIDLSVKLKRRAKPEEVVTQFRAAMTSGAWFVLLNAHKSMNACAAVRDALVEARAAGLPQFDSHARIVISLEQHPHFPKPLIECAVVLKLVASFEGSVVLSDSVATPSLRSRLITAEMMNASQFGGIMTKQPSLTSRPAEGAEGGGGEKATYNSHAAAAPAALTTGTKNTNGEDSSNSTTTTTNHNNKGAYGTNDKGDNKNGNTSSNGAAKHVRISAAVDIVEIPAREVTERSNSQHRGSTATAGRGGGSSTDEEESAEMQKSIDVSGSVVLTKSYRGIVGDKFLCVQIAGTADRYAVGSSLGNVYFLDAQGSALMQTHAHDASIWDVSFASKFDFATGSEDGTAQTWSFSAKHTDTDTNHDTAKDDANANANHNPTNNNSTSHTNGNTTSATLEAVRDVMFGADAAHSLLTRTSTTHLQADVYCATYLRHVPDATSPVICGGLQSTLLIRDTHRDDAEAGAVTTVAMPSNAQVMECMPSYGVCVVGCGNGAVCAVDVERSVLLLSSVRHREKVPAVTVRDDNQLFSGSFDMCILLWDLRVPGGVVSAVGGLDGTTTPPPAPDGSQTPSLNSAHTLKLRNHVTGLSVQDVHLTACAGENLYIWDVRNMNMVLGGYPQGWKGLTRGVVLQSAPRSIVTASQDGVVRFWTYI